MDRRHAHAGAERRLSPDRARLGRPDGDGIPDRRHRQPGLPGVRFPPDHRRHPAVAARLLPAGVRRRRPSRLPRVADAGRFVPDLGGPDALLLRDDLPCHLHNGPSPAEGGRRIPDDAGAGPLLPGDGIAVQHRAAGELHPRSRRGPATACGAHDPAVRREGMLRADLRQGREGPFRRRFVRVEPGVPRQGAGGGREELGRLRGAEREDDPGGGRDRGPPVPVSRGGPARRAALDAFVPDAGQGPDAGGHPDLHGGTARVQRAGGETAPEPGEPRGAGAAERPQLRRPAGAGQGADLVRPDDPPPAPFPSWRRRRGRSTPCRTRER